MRKIQHRPVSVPVAHKARLRVRRRPLPFKKILPTVRWLSVTTLIICLVWGGIRFIATPHDASALDFTPRTIAPTGTAIGNLGVAMADIDGDGDMDVATAGLDGVKIYERTGTNQYAVHIVDTIRTERIQIVDLNNDGSPDILVTLKGVTGIAKWYSNNGGLDFSPHTIGLTGTNPVAYAGDINGDNVPDIITARSEGEQVILSRWMNDGFGNFTETQLAGDSKVTAITVGDVNGNGYRDIVTTGLNGLQRWDTNNATTWERVDIDDSNQNLSHVVIGDPMDGRVFIVTADADKNIVAVYRSLDSDGTFQRIQLEGDADAKTVAPIDFDGDGDLDILVASQDDNSIFWYENLGTDTWTKRTVATNLQSVYGVAVGDADGDGDVDFVAGDHMRGGLYLYERVRALPVATKPTNITESATGSGVVSLVTDLSDGDLDPTRFRIQYSLDGKNWYKPWLTSAKVSAGSVDLKNSNEYQVGSSNAIDTNANAKVTVTLNWDTKSTQNTGGALTGEQKTVQLRIIPRDDKSIGKTVTSDQFTVDNQGPTGLKNLRLTTITANEATLTWTRPVDTSSFSYKIYYGTNSTDVLNEKSAAWDSTNDAKLGDQDTASTTITGLTVNKTYTFKLVATDAFGNHAATASVRGTTSETSGSPTPVPTDIFGGTPTPTPLSSDFPIASETPPPLTSDLPTPTVTFTPQPFSPTPTTSIPSVLHNNRAPVADAGADQVVNPSALVILDGTASFDPDRDSLSYSWRQVEGPKIDIISARTATPSFSAEGENKTYIFELTVADVQGASAVDDVTIATRTLPAGSQVPVSVGPTTPSTTVVEQSPLVRNLLHPADILLFFLSLISTAFLLVERFVRRLQEGGPKKAPKVTSIAERAQPQGKVIHHKTGEPITNAQILIYGQDGKLRSTERTNDQGVFGTFFPVGEYTIGVQVEGFAFSPAGNSVAAPEGSIIYTGGKLVVRDANKPLSLVIPMKPVGAEISSSRVQLLHAWQTMQRVGRLLSWPTVLAGAILNTILVFLAPRPLYLVIEVLYIGLVIIKIALEVRVRPAYGQVRDAITHIPLDLAVVRLFQEGTNRLVMTRVTNNQGKFFALPPAGKYTVTISKPGYATFSKHNVELKSEQDTTLQVTADLMPVTPPSGGLQQARAAIL